MNDKKTNQKDWRLAETFPELITLYMEQSGLSQMELGTRIDMSQGAVRRWANLGVVPDPASLDRLSEELGMSRERLYEIAYGLNLLTPRSRLVDAIVNILLDMDEATQQIALGTIRGFADSVRKNTK